MLEAIERSSMILRLVCFSMALVFTVAGIAMAVPIGSYDGEVAQKTMPVFLDVPTALFIDTTRSGSGPGGESIDAINLEPPEIPGEGFFTCGFDWIIHSNDAYIREISWGDLIRAETQPAAGEIISSGNLSVSVDGAGLTSNPATLSSCPSSGQVVHSVQFALPWSWSLRSGIYIGSVTLCLRQT